MSVSSWSSCRGGSRAEKTHRSWRMAMHVLLCMNTPQDGGPPDSLHEIRMHCIIVAVTGHLLRSCWVGRLSSGRSAIGACYDVNARFQDVDVLP